MDEEKRLSIENKVHVLSTEVSHLQARLDRVVGDLSEENEDIREEVVAIQKEADEIRSRISDLEGWVQDEQTRLDEKREVERKKEIGLWRKKREAAITIIAAIIGAALSFLSQWIF